MQATSHIPRLTEVKRACVLLDVRDSQTEPSPALLFWRCSHSGDWPLQLSASLAANLAARDLCVSPTSFLRLSTSTARSPCRASFVSIVAVKVAISSFASTSSVWLALRSSSSFWAANQLLQNANDLAALWCVPVTGISRQERKQRGTIIIGNPVHRAFEPMATSTESNTSGYLTKTVMLLLPFTHACLRLHHFDILSTAQTQTNQFDIYMYTVCCANWCAFFQKNGRFCCVKWCWLCWICCHVASFGACTHSLQKPRKTCFLE